MEKENQIFSDFSSENDDSKIIQENQVKVIFKENDGNDIYQEENSYYEEEKLKNFNLNDNQNPIENELYNLNQGENILDENEIEQYQTDEEPKPEDLDTESPLDYENENLTIKVSDNFKDCILIIKKKIFDKYNEDKLNLNLIKKKIHRPLCK